MDASESMLAEQRMPQVAQNDQIAIPSMQSGKSQIPIIHAIIIKLGIGI